MSTDFRPLHPCTAPIFRQDHETETWFYAPGYLVLTGTGHADALEARLKSGTPDSPAAVELVRRGAIALRERNGTGPRPFTPLCLTLYLNNTCNLACRYCYSEPDGKASQRLEMDMIQTATELVAKNCTARHRRMTVVFHGGGEPSLEQGRLEQALELVEQATQAHSVDLFRYIATNGVMPAERAAGLARRFDLIGLSCDGPEAIQSQQRPLRGGQSSTPWAESTARLVHQAGKPLHIRVTITPTSLHRQSEIAAYICEQLQPQEIHVEPVYQAGLAKAEDCFEPGQAEDFVREFLRAREIASRYGVRWMSSGNRPAEIHGPYCHVFRDVLNLIPGGEATACFRISHTEELHQKGLSIGSFDPRARQYILEQDQVEHLRRMLNRQPEKCAACFNQFHCTRGCPDQCLVADRDVHRGEFRCRVNMLLAQSALEECAAALRSLRTSPEQVIGRAITA